MDKALCKSHIHTIPHYLYLALSIPSFFLPSLTMENMSLLYAVQMWKVILSLELVERKQS